MLRVRKNTKNHLPHNMKFKTRHMIHGFRRGWQLIVTFRVRDVKGALEC
jgi:hypothetical protein